LPVISSLRYFYEKYRELHVITAGSLLEFAFQELSSFRVGRVGSMFMYPVSFILAREILEKHPEVKKKLWGGEFWSDGYFVSTVSKLWK
jgi:REP element-mobilizing transposase RayT